MVVFLVDLSFPDLSSRLMLIKGYMTQHKVQTICSVFSATGILYIILNLHAKEHANDCNTVSPSQEVNKGPVYWLSASNADSGYMNHVKETFKRIGYQRWDEKNGDWDVMWSYEYPFGQTVTSSSLKPHQRVNHFPGSGYLTSKGYLALSKSRYIPLAFSLPQNETHFRKYVSEHPEKIWVQKSNKHRGIKIKSRNELDFSAKDSFIQEFVRKPFLVDGRKFDIGIYTVISSIDPLLVYVLDTEWLIRFCPEDYEPFDPANVRKYVVEDDYTATWQMPSLMDGYKRAKLSHKESLLRYIKKKGHDSDKLKKKLYEAVAELVWEKQKNILGAVSYYPYGSKSFFELVRFDFVLDENLNVYAMEVNMSPNLSSGHFSDNARMYRQVVFNTLSLVGIAMDRNHIQPLAPLEQEMAVSDHDIAAFPDSCASCTSCLDAVCKLCNECLVVTIKYALKMAYRQHVDRRNFKRVYPKPLESKESAANYQPQDDNKLYTDADKAIALWFKGMCIKNEDWCT